jgi:hypothetical protein
MKAIDNNIQLKRKSTIQSHRANYYLLLLLIIIVCYLITIVTGQILRKTKLNYYKYNLGLIFVFTFVKGTRSFSACGSLSFD